MGTPKLTSAVAVRPWAAVVILAALAATIGTATGARSARSSQSPSTPGVPVGSSRSVTGRMVVELGTPGRRLTSVASRMQGLGMEADDDGVVGAGLDVELVDDGLDDRVGRHRARESLEDAGDAFGLAAPALLAAAHGFAMEDRREPAQRHEAGEEPVDRLAAVEDEPGGSQDGQEEERSGEDPPCPPDATILRLRVARSPGGGACHGLKDGGYGR